MSRFFVKLAKVVGHPEWAREPRYATNGARVAHKDALIDAIGAIIATRRKGEWIDALDAEGVPCGVIDALPETVAHPQAQALGIVEPGPRDEDLTLIALPLSFDGCARRSVAAPEEERRARSRGDGGERTVAGVVSGTRRR